MGNKQVVAIIPARMGASRYPGKPLASILDLPMIEHVRRRVTLSEAIDEVYVATCDKEIFDTVAQFGGKAIMTKDTHERCTDRVEEAAHKIDLDICVIVQGDEPLFMPEVLSELVSPLLDDDSIPCTNLISTIRKNEDLDDVDIVKTVVDERGFVMYFSRASIPYMRINNNCPFYRQTGVSAFTKSFLHTYANLSPTALEVTESVDFLRVIGHGYPIKGVVYESVTLGVDRPDDVRKVEAVLSEDKEQKKIYERILKA